MAVKATVKGKGKARKARGVTLVAWCRGKGLRNVISVHVLDAAGRLPACGQLAAREDVRKPKLSAYLQTAMGGHGFVVGKPGADTVQGTHVTCVRCAATAGLQAQVPPPLANRMARATVATTPRKATTVRKPARKGRKTA